MTMNAHIDVYEPSEDDYELFIAKLDDISYVFVSFRGRHICAPQRDTNMASPYIIISSPLQRSAKTQIVRACPAIVVQSHEPLQDCLNIHLLLSL